LNQRGVLINGGRDDIPAGELSKDVGMFKESLSNKEDTYKTLP